MIRAESLVESRYAWARLCAALALMTVGGSGMYAITVVLPSVQADFGVSRSDASLPYTFTMIGFGLGYEYTGREEYLNKGLALLEELVKAQGVGERVKTFAQEFRASPYFLKCLTVGFKPRPVLTTQPAGKQP